MRPCCRASDLLRCRVANASLTDEGKLLTSSSLAFAEVASQVGALHVREQVIAALAHRHDVIERGAHRVRRLESLVDLALADTAAPTVPSEHAPRLDRFVCHAEPSSSGSVARARALACCSCSCCCLSVLSAFPLTVEGGEVAAPLAMAVAPAMVAYHLGPTRCDDGPRPPAHCARSGHGWLLTSRPTVLALATLRPPRRSSHHRATTSAPSGRATSTTDARAPSSGDRPDRAAGLDVSLALAHGVPTSDSHGIGRAGWLACLIRLGSCACDGAGRLGWAYRTPRSTASLAHSVLLVVLGVVACAAPVGSACAL